MKTVKERRIVQRQQRKKGGAGGGGEGGEGRGIGGRDERNKEDE